MGASTKEFFRLVEEFVDLIGTQMKGFQDIYEVTENLGEPFSPLSCCTLCRLGTRSGVYSMKVASLTHTQTQTHTHACALVPKVKFRPKFSPPPVLEHIFPAT